MLSSKQPAALRLAVKDVMYYRSMRKMEVKELRESLEDFNQAGSIMVAIPSLAKPHELRSIRLVGHLDHPGVVQMDTTKHVIDIVCDSWDGTKPAQAFGPPGTPEPDKLETIADLHKELTPFPDSMHVRVAVPVTHGSLSHRMLDIVMIGHAVSGGRGIQLVCENWDFPTQIIKELPEVAAARETERVRIEQSVPPGEALSA